MKVLEELELLELAAKVKYNNLKSSHGQCNACKLKCIFYCSLTQTEITSPTTTAVTAATTVAAASLLQVHHPPQIRNQNPLHHTQTLILHPLLTRPVQASAL